HSANRQAARAATLAPHLAGGTGPDAFQLHHLFRDGLLGLVRSGSVPGTAAVDGRVGDGRAEPSNLGDLGGGCAAGLGLEPAVGTAPAAPGRTDRRPERPGDRYGS